MAVKKDDQNKNSKLICKYNRRNISVMLTDTLEILSVNICVVPWNCYVTLFFKMLYCRVVSRNFLNSGKKSKNVFFFFIFCIRVSMHACIIHLEYRTSCPPKCLYTTVWLRSKVSVKRLKKKYRHLCFFLISVHRCAFWTCLWWSWMNPINHR